MFEYFPENELEFLRECELYANLSERTLQSIFKRGRLVQLSPGQELFQVGSSADNFYVVKSGMVEICRLGDKPDEVVTVAFLGRGDSIGELTMLTGTDHAVLARAPEGGEVFEVPRRNFRTMLEAYPEFAIHLCNTFAERLESSVKNESGTRNRQFHGHLKYFDLATVIQTIVVSRMTGRLVVTDDFGNAYSEIYFDAGDPSCAKIGHLSGPEAFNQLFQPPPVEGTFDFKSGERPPRELLGLFEGCPPGMNMLMDAIRMQDELDNFRPQIDLESIYQPQQTELIWEGEERYLVLANDIWYRLHAEQPTVVQLLQEVPSCHYGVYYVLATMKQAGLIVSSMDTGLWQKVDSAEGWGLLDDDDV
ncbi:MAG: cyclic nucleotide-binding domain-containing protein [Acidobacteria bacterium]|nr:cyclic nucleotide-binding domain-containing protein [Acidobacteriota bacterium]